VGFLVVLLAIAAAFSVLEVMHKTDPLQLTAPPPGISSAAQDTGEHLTISWLGMPSFPGGQSGLWVQSMLEERFNITFDPIFMDPNGYDRKKPLMLSGGSIPDVIWEADPLTLQRAVHHRFIAELPYDLIKKHAPTVFAELSANAPVAWLYSHVDGRNYGLPTKNVSGLRPRPGIWRMDWLRNVGIDSVPETLEEFEEALRRLTHDDPNRTGMRDTHGMSGDISHWWWASFSEIFGAFGVLPFDWQVLDGEVVWGGVHPRSREALGVLREWFQQGLIHPDFVTDNSLFGQSLERKFFAGRIGYIYYRALYHEMDTRLANSFYSRFLSLQIAEILHSQDGLAVTLLQRVPRKILDDYSILVMESLLDNPPAHLCELLCSAFAAQLHQQLPDGDFNQAHVRALYNYLQDISEDVRLRILTQDMKHGLETGSLQVAAVSAPLSFSEEELQLLQQPPPAGRMPYEFRQTILSALRQALINELLVQFPDTLREQLTLQLREELLAGLRLVQDSDGNLQLSEFRKESIVNDIASGRYNGLLRQLNRIVEEETRDSVARGLNANLLNLLWDDLRWQLHFGNVPHVLAVGLFPEGPHGDRGARSWGAGGNIITFGRQVVDNPEIAVRVLRMFETFYQDRELFKESRSGRRGVHWEWSDPDVGQGSGTSFSREYMDPDTGRTIDLQAGSTAHRMLLNHELSFFNPVGSTEENQHYFEDEAALEFDERYRRLEWALVNVLGKSDVVPSATRYLGDLRNRQQTVYAEIVRGDRPLEYFDEFVQYWYARGGDVLTQEARELFRTKQEIYARLGVSDEE
jgi:ABC-type glycerol-3-phosphate transport system substrate-binding protein